MIRFVNQEYMKLRMRKQESYMRTTNAKNDLRLHVVSTAFIVRLRKNLSVNTEDPRPFGGCSAF